MGIAGFAVIGSKHIQYGGFSESARLRDADVFCAGSDTFIYRSDNVGFIDKIFAFYRLVQRQCRAGIQIYSHLTPIPSKAFLFFHYKVCSEGLQDIFRYYYCNTISYWLLPITQRHFKWGIKLLVFPITVNINPATENKLHKQWKYMLIYKFCFLYATYATGTNANMRNTLLKGSQKW